MQSPGKIFLADQRGVKETSCIRRYSTFNSGDFFNEHKQPFDNLYVFNDEWIAGSGSMKVCAVKRAWLILIPVTGELILKAGTGNKVKNISIEEVYISAVNENERIELVNPFKSDAVNFLQFWISMDLPFNKFGSLTIPFDLTAYPDTLVPVMSSHPVQLPFNIAIGRFSGRKEAVYLQDKSSKLFVFVISGAFELEGRLLHERDGLALWNTESVEIEALSNNAVLLMVELFSAPEI